MRRITLAAALTLSFVAIPIGAQDEDSSARDTARAMTTILGAVEILSAIEKSILLTEQPCEALGQGWTNYRPLDGRFALAAGKGVDTREEKRVFEPHDQGGTYKHELTEQEMPSHTHDYRDRYNSSNFADYGDDQPTGRKDEDRETKTKGAGEPHNNMPPYWVLNFCHKRL